MNLSKRVFTSKYLNKKHAVSALFLGIIILYALFLVLSLFLLFTQPQKPENGSLVRPALFSGLVILTAEVLVVWTCKRTLELYR